MFEIVWDTHGFLSVIGRRILRPLVALQWTLWGPRVVLWELWCSEYIAASQEWKCPKCQNCNGPWRPLTHFWESPSSRWALRRWGPNISHVTLGFWGVPELHYCGNTRVLTPKVWDLWGCHMVRCGRFTWVSKWHLGIHECLRESQTCKSIYPNFEILGA